VFVKGDVITVTARVDANWVHGIASDGSVVRSFLAHMREFCVCALSCSVRLVLDEGPDLQYSIAHPIYPSVCVMLLLCSLVRCLLSRFNDAASILHRVSRISSLTM
jgi:hypothetical protein